MKNCLLIITACFFLTSAFSQTDTEKSRKKFVPSIATIKMINGVKTKGWFYKMDDENIYLLPVKKNGKNLPRIEILSADKNAVSSNISTSQISTITLQKRNTGVKAALIGLGIGAATGIVIGFSEGDDPPDRFVLYGSNMTASQKAIAGAFVLGGFGSVAGLILSNIIKKKFIIGGQKDTYRDLQGELMKRLIIK